MKTYHISTVWQMWGVVVVEAESLEEAKEKALGPDYLLPTDSNYIDDSQEIDHEGCEVAP